MRIALLSQPANFHCRKWAAALVRAGAQVCVYSLDDRTEIPEVSVRQIPTSIRWGGRYRFPAYWTTAASLRRILADDRIDLLHPMGLTPFGLWGMWSGFRPLVPAAIGADVFDFLPRHLIPPGHLNWSAKKRNYLSYEKIKYILSKNIYRNWIIQLVAQSDALTCDNQPLQQALMQGFAARDVRLIRWGIPTASDSSGNDHWPHVARELGIPADARLLLAPRGANPFYGADIILQAFALLLSEASSLIHEKNIFSLMLTAGYPVSESIRRLAQQLAAMARFRLVERVFDAREMQALWSRTDVFISAPAYDGFSAAETEGRWAGALPVLNDIPAHREWADPDRNAWIVQPFTAENLAATLKQLIPQIEDLRPTVRRLSRDWIARYADLDRQAGQFLQLADRVIRKARQ